MPDEDDPYRHPWLGLAVRHLATLAAVARTRSFRQAAVDVGYGPSAVRDRIASLEAVVGTRLVERGRGQRPVTLTPAGRLLLERSVGVIEQLRAARLDVLACDALGGTVIRLAIAADAAPLLERLVARATRELAGVQLQVTETDDAGLVSRLARGSADFAIGSPPPDSAISTAILLEDPFVVLTNADSELARLPGVTSPEQLREHRLIVARSALAGADLRAGGLRLDRAVEVPLAAAIPPLVAGRVGIGLVPRSDVEHTPAGLVALPTAGLIAPRRVLLAWHASRRRSAPLVAFCDIAKTAFSAGMSTAPVADLAPAA